MRPLHPRRKEALQVKALLNGQVGNAPAATAKVAKQIVGKGIEFGVSGVAGKHRRRGARPPKDARNPRKILIKMRHCLVAARGDEGLYPVHALCMLQVCAGVELLKQVHHGPGQNRVVRRGLKAKPMAGQVDAKQVV